MPSIKSLSVSLLGLIAVGSASATSLSDLCTVDNVQAALPANGTFNGIEIYLDSVTAEVTTESSAGAGSMRRRQVNEAPVAGIQRRSQTSTSTMSGSPGGSMSAGSGTQSGSAPSSSSTSSSSSSSGTEYCNITVGYTHSGSGDRVNLLYAFPKPSSFKNRFYVAGGGGYSLSSSATGGLDYDAASGATDAGYDAFSYSFDEKFLYGNGSINWQTAHMFGYQALGEMTKIGKYMAPRFYGSSDDTKIYTYFSGCSDGGREGMSQVQRWGTEYDGVVAGAPALRFAQQQVLHVFPATVEHTEDYYPPTCALAKIVNETISACDPLDGRTDGVISRTDLCKLHFDLDSIVGTSYECAAETSSSMGFGFSKRAEGSESSTTPAQSGKVTHKDVAIAKKVYDGLFDSSGNRAYLSWQIGAELEDADPTYDDDTDEWTLNIPSTGGLYVRKYIELLDLDNLDSLTNVTYDTLVHWMETGFVRYYDSLQTTLPNLTPFKESGGKLIHYHGESDPSIPTGSSVHYRQSVRKEMYPHLSASEGEEKLNEWYQFYLVPGAAHCGANDLQPGPYPSASSLMSQIIKWVEDDDKPTGLNATVSSGTYEGENQWLCQWPKRPLWTSTSSFDCVHDKKSIESWTYEFPAFRQAVY